MVAPTINIETTEGRAPPPPIDAQSPSPPGSNGQLIIYPESDGNRMADNTKQFEYIVTIQGGIAALFADRDDVFVAGDLLWYPVEGNNRLRIAPDVLVAFGRPRGHRGSYLQWREASIPPHVVFEVLSPGNTAAEMESKLDFYQYYGVEEYYLYDPDRGRLLGWLRGGNRLEKIPAMQQWVSPRLGIRFTLVGADLVIYRPDGARFETFIESWQRAEAATARAAAATEQARAATEQAAAERERAEAATERAEIEYVRRERLLIRLRELGIDPASLE